MATATNLGEIGDWGEWTIYLWEGTEGRMNSVIIIHPYKYFGGWVFDDPAVGLVREAFVAGADDIIERMVEHIPDADGGFNLIFSAEPFPGHQTVFEWRREDGGGNWYYSAEVDAEGWLCPALFKYFEAAPPRIYAQFKPGASDAVRRHGEGQ
jgi:hypothetical protein